MAFAVYGILGKTPDVNEQFTILARGILMMSTHDMMSLTGILSGPLVSLLSKSSSILLPQIHKTPYCPHHRSVFV